MSTSAFPNKFDWIRAISDPNSGLTSTQHHVALALSQHLNVEGKGFVTQAQLAIDIRMCEKTVNDALTALADMHWIERVPGRPGEPVPLRVLVHRGPPIPARRHASRACRAVTAQFRL